MSPTPLTEQIAGVLGARIINGELEAGEVLRLELLGTEFGVSRTVVREAVKVLESHNLVTSRRRVGVRVLPATEWNALSPFVLQHQLAGPYRLDQLQAISQLRRGVEPVAAALAAERASADQRTELVDSATAMEAANGDLDSYLDHDIRFHSTLLQASANPLMMALSGIVTEVLTARHHYELMPPEPTAAARRLHVEVARAVAAGDAGTAERAMREIVEEAWSGVTEISGRRAAAER
ncbi:GntR family transcriptional regulator [Enemella evansiae]|uniref:FadR/GntR family transcriptional regulator n=1 Tax=Enemella evansiae TaxID=2016499 RepID=UPI000B960E42|nr:FCD domain-containing protein [Enemella evansiae]OYO10945.1 GntR family transcriptional regulator [Enemella evansiae]